MHRIFLALPFMAALAGCDATNMGMTDQQMMGTAGGAAIGAVVTPHNPLQGALIGGAVGLAAGTYLGRDTSGGCVYQRANGTRYVATCP